MEKLTLPNAFKPFTISITIESHDEQNALWSMALCNLSVPQAVDNNTEGIEYKTVQMFLKKLQPLVKPV